MAKIKRIAVWRPVGDPQQTPLLRGISDYARQRGTWVLQTNPEMFSRGLRDLAQWPGAGLIAVVRSKAEIAAARALKIPVVNPCGFSGARHLRAAFKRVTGLTPAEYRRPG
jgi:hypothetical protein